MECMSDDSIRPNIKDLQKDNIIWATIEALLNYWEETGGQNSNKKCAIIGYEIKSNLVFEDVPIKDIGKRRYSIFIWFFKKIKL